MSNEYIFKPTRAPTEADVLAMKNLAGVYWDERRGLFRAHYNVAWLAERTAFELKLPLRVVVRPTVPLPLKALPLVKELRPGVVEALFPYQVETLLRAIPADGMHVWAGCGCIAGDAEVTVNRGGNARRMRLDTLVFKFNGGVSSQQGSRNRGLRKWDLTIPTYVQSYVDGYIRKQRVMAAVVSGVKPVLRIETESGRVIRATPEHRFLNGAARWVEARRLTVGTPIRVVAWPTAGQKPWAPKALYAQISGLWQHPHVLLGVEHGSQHGRAEGWKHVLATTAPDRVRSITREAPVETFDLTVEGEPNFVANDIVVHNSGKTLLAIIWGLAASGMVLLVCPAKARRSFARQVRQYTTVEPVVLEGFAAPDEATMDALRRARIIITTWSVLHQHVALLMSLKPYSVVCDELHHVKQWKRSRRVPVASGVDIDVLMALADDAAPAEVAAVLATPAVNAAPSFKWEARDNLANAAQDVARVAKRRLGTTATPIRDRLRDLWGQLHLIHPWGWGSFTAWSKAFCDAHFNVWGGLDSKGKGNAAELAILKQRLSFVVHQVPMAVTHRDLPLMRREVLYIPVSEQNTETTGFLDELRKAKGAPHSKLLEIRLAAAASRKRDFVLELVLEAVRSSQKVVIFTGRRKDCELLGTAVQKKLAKQPDAQVWIAHGDTTANERDNIRLKYMDAPGPAVLVGTGQAWGESLDLQDTDLAYFVMLPPSPGDVEQWEGRFRRLGMKRPVLIRHCVAEGTVDEHYIDILLNKVPTVDAMVGSGALTGFAKQLATGGKSFEELCEDLVTGILGKP